MCPQTADKVGRVNKCTSRKSAGVRAPLTGAEYRKLIDAEVSHVWLLLESVNVIWVFEELPRVNKR